jgi:hypothetical protein
VWFMPFIRFGIPDRRKPLVRRPGEEQDWSPTRKTLGTGRWLTRQVQTRPNLKIWTPALIWTEKILPDVQLELPECLLENLEFSLHWQGTYHSRETDHDY